MFLTYYQYGGVELIIYFSNQIKYELLWFTMIEKFCFLLGL